MSDRERGPSYPTTIWRIVAAVAGILPLASFWIGQSLFADEPEVFLVISLVTFLASIAVGGVAVQKMGRGLGWVLLALLLYCVPYLIVGVLPGPKRVEISDPGSITQPVESLLRWRERADRASSLKNSGIGLATTGIVLFLIAQWALSVEIGVVFGISLALSVLAIGAALLIWISGLVAAGCAEPKCRAFKEALVEADEVREAAIDYLARYTAKKENRQRPRRVRAAMEILSDLGGEKAASTLGALSRDRRPENQELRSAAIKSLGTTAAEGVVAPLLEAMADDDPEMRLSAVLALQEAGNPRVLEQLREVESKKLVPGTALLN